MMAYILLSFICLTQFYNCTAERESRKVDYTSITNKNIFDHNLQSGSDTFPNFRLFNVNDEQVYLHSQKVKFYVLITLWNSKNIPNEKDLDEISQLYFMYETRMTFISISNDADLKKWKEFLTKYNFKGVNLIDKKNTVDGSLSIKTLPTFMLLDPKFKVLDIFDNISTLKNQLNEYYFQYDNIMYH